MQKIKLGDKLMLIVFFRALILYAVIFIVIRLMGKKELSKVQPFELSIIILISDLASAPMSSRGISIFDGIVPIITLLIAYMLFTIITHSSNKIEDAVCGTMTLIIKDGKILEKELKEQKYTMSDLMVQLREKNVFKVQDVKYGMLETNGSLTVITYKDCDNSLPLNIIEDGEYSKSNMEILNMDEKDVNKILKKEKIKLENVLIGTIDEESKFIYQLKDEVKA